MATSWQEVKTPRFYNAEDVQRICGVGRAKAYQLIKQANERLAAMGKFVIAGKVNAKFFDEQF